MVVPGFVDNPRPNLFPGRHAKCCNHGSDELTDMRIVPVLLCGLRVVDAGLTLRMIGEFFCNLLVEQILLCSTLECRERFWEVDIRRYICFLMSITAAAVLIEAGLSTHRSSGLTFIAKQTGFRRGDRKGHNVVDMNSV